MNLTKKKLKELYDKSYSKSAEILSRFTEIEDIVDRFEKLNINNKYIKDFAPLSDGILGRDGNGNRQTMKDKNVDNVDDMWKLIGGFDGQKVQAKYRIISASRGSRENYKENEDYSVFHQSLWANSNFVTNNYPHQIAQFLKSCNSNKSFEDCVKDSKIVLTWKTTSYLEEDDYFMASQNRLETRFPPKFLWMWANKDTVIHPISLMAFRNFLNTEYGKEVNKDYTPENITNMKFDDFKSAWKKISSQILQDLVDDYDSKINDEKKEIISKVSKLISEVSIEETDIKNISDLLTTGNRAVILWGPPGTGKTYESMEVVKELLGLDESLTDEKIEDEYLFSKINKVIKDKGCYEIIQFHPNYTYQDFIGGISPKLDGIDVSYTLNHGIFKQFCDSANDNPKKDFIFIIDEINRAELSAVFGELLFALEYRGKSIQIPHFKESFTIPENVYIIGTMNNVDKSLVTFDLALRRRFGFFKLMPKLEVIEDVLSEIVEKDSLKKYYNKCKKLNILISNTNKEIDDEEITKDEKKLLLKLGKDYQIGQAYFLKIRDFLNQEKIKNNELQIITSFELEKLWVYHIEPLLEEYLGMTVEDEGIESKLKELKDNFIEDK